MKFAVNTKGFTDIVDISSQVRSAVAASGVAQGVAHVFVQGSTAALSTIEFESGAVRDLKEALERIAPRTRTTTTTRLGAMATATHTCEPP